MKKLLMSAFIGSSNLGDQAIFTAITQQIKKHPDIAVTAFTLDRSKHHDGNVIRYIETKNPFTIINEIHRCDLLIIGGGGIIQDETTIYNLLRHTYKALIAIFLGKKYMFYAVGVSELTSGFNKILARFVLDRAVAITVRDEESKNNVRRLGVSQDVTVTADPAVNLRVKRKHLPDPSKAFIVVCLRHWFDINRYIPVAAIKKLHLRSSENQRKYRLFIKTIAACLDWIVETYNYKIVFIPLFDMRDDKVHNAVLEEMSQSAGCVNIKPQLSIQDTISLIADSEFVIGMRLHSIIFAAQQHTPFLALNYAQKVTNFLGGLSLKYYGIDLKRISLFEFKKRFTVLHKNRRKIQFVLKREMRILQRKEKKNHEIFTQTLWEH